MSDGDQNQLGLIHAGIARMEKDLCIVKEILTGNGEPDKGIVVKVARLEQSMGAVRRLFWVVIGSLSTSVGALLYYVLTGN